MPEIDGVIGLDNYINSLECIDELSHDALTFNNGQLYYKTDIRNANKAGVPLIMDPITSNDCVHMNRLCPEKLRIGATDESHNYYRGVQKAIYDKSMVQIVSALDNTIMMTIMTMLPTHETGVACNYTLTGVDNVKIDSAFCPYFSPPLYVLKRIFDKFGGLPIMTRDASQLTRVTGNVNKRNITATLISTIVFMLNAHLHFISGLGWIDTLYHLRNKGLAAVSRAPDAYILDHKDAVTELITLGTHNITSGQVNTIDSNINPTRRIIDTSRTRKMPLDSIKSIPDEQIKRHVISKVQNKEPSLISEGLTEVQAILSFNTFIVSEPSVAIEKSGNTKANCPSLCVGRVLETCDGVPIRIEPSAEFQGMYDYLTRHIRAGVDTFIKQLEHTSSVELFSSKLTTRSQGIKEGDTTQRYMSFLQNHEYLSDQEELVRLVTTPNVSTSRAQVGRRMRNIQAINNATQYVYLPMYEIINASHFPNLALDDMVGNVADYASLLDDSSDSNTLCSYADVKGMDASWHAGIMALIMSSLYEAILNSQQISDNIVPYPPFSLTSAPIINLNTRKANDSMISPLAQCMALAIVSLTNLLTNVRGLFGTTLSFNITLASGMLPTSQLNSIMSLAMNLVAYDRNISSTVPRGIRAYNHLHVLGDDQTINLSCDVGEEGERVAAERLSYAASLMGFAIDGFACQHFNEFLMVQAACGIRVYKPQQPTTITSEYTHWSKTANEILAGISAGALELASRSRYSSALSIVWPATMMIAPQYVKRGAATKFSFSVIARGYEKFRVYPSPFAIYLNPSTRYLFLPQMNETFVPGSHAIVPSSPITAFLYLSTALLTSDGMANFSDIPDSFLEDVGFYEAVYLVNKDSTSQIVRARKYQLDAQALYSQNIHVLKTPTIVKSDIALTTLHALSVEKHGRRIPWAKIVPPGMSARENVQQRILYAYAKKEEKKETIEDMDSLTYVSYKRSLPDWWNRAAIRCEMTPAPLTYHSHTTGCSPVGSNITTYLSARGDSTRYAILRRLGLMSIHTVHKSKTTIEKWSKSVRAADMIEALREARRHVDKIPELVDLLFDTFGIPNSLRQSLTNMLEKEQKHVDLVNFSPINKYIEIYNLSDITAMTGVETNVLNNSKIVMSSAHASASAYYSIFCANSDRVIRIMYSPNAMFAAYAITSAEWETYTNEYGIDAMTVLKRKDNSKGNRSLYQPVDPARLHASALSNWILHGKPETAQW
jgi:hypothetical protein